MKPGASWYRKLVASRLLDRPKRFPAAGAELGTRAYVREYCRLNGLKQEPER